MDFDELQEGLTELRENLQSAEEELLELENVKGAELQGKINEIFRMLHNAKGGAGFLGLNTISDVAHALENLWTYIRSGEIQLSRKLIDEALSALDLLKDLAANHESSNEKDCAERISQINSLLNSELGSDSGGNEKIKEPESSESVSIPFEVFEVSKEKLEISGSENRYHYVLLYVKEPGQDLEESLRELSLVGFVLDHQSFAKDSHWLSFLAPSSDVLAVLLASRLDLDALAVVSGLLPEQIYPVGASVFLKILENRTKKQVSKNLQQPQGKAKSLPEKKSSQKKKVETTTDDAVSNELVFLSKKTDQNITSDEDFEPEPVRRLLEKEVKTSDPKEDRGNLRKHDTVRISVGLLDQLMTLAGELVLIRNQQLRAMEQHGNTPKDIVQRLDLVTSEIQETILRTRMQPVGQIFNKYKRVVRELEGKLKKRMSLDIIGADVELDSAILEGLSEPLKHIIRNSCDHGIELPSEREAIGKDPQGKITLAAFHEGDQIHIEVRDDGRGLNLDKIKKKALEKRLKTADELEKMQEKEIYKLVLLPGFSTATEVTDISGRGVGMDVVKTEIENLGGIIDLQSFPYEGMTISMKLPLTLTIISSLIVEMKDQKFAIPQINIDELICLYDEEVNTGVEVAQGKEYYRRRGNLLPLVRLSRVLAEEEGSFSPVSLKRLNIVVLKVGTRSFGLIVDRVQGSEEIVVKPMHSLVKNIDQYSGTTILGDGKVALILDVQGLGRKLGVLEESQYLDEETASQEKETLDLMNLLLFKSGPEEVFAVELSTIQRIEMISMSAIERMGGVEHAIIHEKPVQIVRMEQLIGISPCEWQENVYLLIPKNLPGDYGLIVSQIKDTVSVVPHLEKTLVYAPGVLGSQLIREKLTLVVNVSELIRPICQG